MLPVTARTARIIDLTSLHPRYRVAPERLASADGAPSLACNWLTVHQLEH